MHGWSVAESRSAGRAGKAWQPSGESQEPTHGCGPCALCPCHNSPGRRDDLAIGWRVGPKLGLLHATVPGGRRELGLLHAIKPDSGRLCTTGVRRRARIGVPGVGGHLCWNLSESCTKLYSTGNACLGGSRWSAMRQSPAATVLQTSAGNPGSANTIERVDGNQ
jgi:hypothetical protein